MNDMPFVSLDEGRRIEAAEVALLRKAAQALTRLRPKDTAVLPIGSGLAFYGGPESPFNKVAGLGFTAADVDTPVPRDAELDAVEQMFFERSTPVQVELSSLGDPAVLRALHARGYAPVGFEYVSGRPLLPSSPPAAADLEIVDGEAVDWPTWLEVMVSGFETPDSAGIASHQAFPRDVLRASISDFSSAEGMRHYLASRRVAGSLVPAGGGAVMLTEDIAQLCGAATLPDHRGQGVQTALLHRRLADAAKMGCTLATVTTQPASTSLSNMHKHGFEVLYIRLILVKTPPSSSTGPRKPAS